MKTIPAISFSLIALFLTSTWSSGSLIGQDVSVSKTKAVEKAALETIAASTDFFRSLATNGGYVYYYSVDLKRRLGEGAATPSQIWVQPPGTPTVGEAFLDAFEATHDPKDLKAAKEAGYALVYGQLRSGGWTALVDFDRSSKLAGRYRNGLGNGKNNSSFDDDQTGAALRFLIRLDQALKFKDAKISEAVQFALNSLLAAQFPNGGFPQVWTEPVPDRPVVAACYPNYDWKTENRIKEYWSLYTLNDNVAGSIARTLIAAHQTYGQEAFRSRLKRLGQFLILAQMPAPQPGWAQQYDYQMRPVWARRFEPPAVSSDETQEAIDTLLMIATYCEAPEFLEPIPKALKWLESCEQDSNKLSRYYELETNRPLYMNRRGKNYFLTYSDASLPKHYGWKITSRIESLKNRWVRVKSGDLKYPELISEIEDQKSATEKEVLSIAQSIDSQGRWLNEYHNQRLVGQPRFTIGEKYISSQTFADNISLLTRFLED